MDPLTLAHLLYGRRITSLPYEFVNEEEVDDPTFSDQSHVRRSANNRHWNYNTLKQGGGMNISPLCKSATRQHLDMVQLNTELLLEMWF